MKLFRRILLLLAVVIVVLNWTWGRLPGEPPLPAGSHFATIDGVKIHYVESPGTGPGVIMIHGHPGTYLDWKSVQTKLPGTRTVAVDRPGYAFSDGGYVPFDQQVKIVHDLAVKLGMRKPVIAGHSYGGTLALAYAQAYPKDTRAIVPVDPAVDPDDTSNTFDNIQAHAVKVLQWPVVRPVANATFNQLLLSASAKPQVEQAFSTDPANSDYEHQLKALNLKSSDLKTFADETLAFKDDAVPAMRTFPSVAAPAFFVQGKTDKLVSPEAVTEVAHQMPNAHLLLLSGGHMQTWVHPAQVAASIRAAIAAKQKT
jgi:pimeloyl-ACP methyl ester carboxylesterase